MSCYHPMVLIKTSDMTDPEQVSIVKKLQFRHKHNKKIRSVNTLLIPRELAEREGVDLRDNNAILVPCGRCIGCKLDYSRGWAERCMFEAKSHEFNYFLTLTYDDDHLPIGSKGIPTLVKDEISSFMKRLREKLRVECDHVGVKFFGCGEYGSKGLRPHYHVILFNCPLPDLQERHPVVVDGKLKWIRQYDNNNEPLLFSKMVYDSWEHKGSCTIGQVTFESCAYVSRYVVKKQYGLDSKQYVDSGVIAPFVRMSRNPGIAQSYYVTNLNKIADADNVIYKRGDRTVVAKPGRYFDKLLQKFDENLYYRKKQSHSLDFYDGVDCKTFEGVDVSINNHHAEQVKLHSVKLLKRSL